MKDKNWKIITNGVKILVIFLLFGCQNEPSYWEVKPKEQVITQYLESHNEFSDFFKILKLTGLDRNLSVRGPFTLFLPSDVQMKEYYNSKSFGSFNDFDVEFLKQLVLNHVIGDYIESQDIGFGAIGLTNALGDYIPSEFEGSEILLNKNSKIVKRNIVVANGIIHHVDKVLEPVSLSVYDVLEQNPSFSIFTQGLQKTGLKDTLQLVTYSNAYHTTRCRFTIFAVADTTFNRYGILSIDDLIDCYTADYKSLTSANNEFYRFMEYHCITGTYFFNSLSTNYYPTISCNNNLFIEVTDDYKISPTQEQEYTGLIISQSNTPAKNGTIHAVAGMLNVPEPKPQRIVWETTNHIEITESEFYKKHYKKWFDGQNTFADIKWEGNYLLYYYKDRNAPEQLNWDCLSMSGWWWIEVTTPKIMKGNYRISGNIWANNIDYEVYVDGVITGFIRMTDPAKSTTWAEVNWDKTERHKVKIVAKSPGELFWDTIIFEPIE